MKKLGMLLFALVPFVLLAQQTEYNRKGDEAMKRLDYRDARMWFEEGVTSCDSYSIDKLTSIWLSNETMRPSMRSIMNKCLNCLNDKANAGDTVSISKLVIYYEEGISIPPNQELANYWSGKLSEIHRKEEEALHPSTVPAAKPAERMKFFLGYAYSIEAPFGLTIGGVGRRFGWYARFKSNFSFESTDYNCQKIGDTEELIDFNENASYRFIPGEKKTNTYMASAGLVVKFTPWLYTSFGAGYGKRDLLWKYETHDKTNYDTKTAWAKNKENSYKGVVVEIDMMVQFDRFFVSAGVSTLSFEYSDLNAGVGIFF